MDMQKVSVEFRCPDCGGNRWGTENGHKPVEEWIGHCRNENYRCSFEWLRKEDWKFFIFIIHPTKEQYERYHAKDQAGEEEIVASVVFP